MSTAKVIDLNKYGLQGERPQRVATSLQDALQGFQDAIATAGLGKPEIEADGRIHRFDLPDEARGKKSGWYVLYPDDSPCPAGSFGNWKDDSSETWMAIPKYEISKSDMDKVTERLREARSARDEERRREADLAASGATEILAASPVATDDHPYLQKKQVKAFDLRLGDRGALLVPMLDKYGNVRGLQRIMADGKKLFHKGVDPRGLFHFIDGDRSSMYVCEGYATGASIHMATGQGVIVAFNCGNLEHVAVVAKELFPQAKIVLAADDDKWTKKQDGSPYNPGIEHAKAVGARLGMQVISPSFRDLSTRPTDFNDLHVLEGIEAVRSQVKGYSVRIDDWSVASMREREIPEREWLVENTVPLNGAMILAAPGGMGKGMVMLDLAIKVAIDPGPGINLNPCDALGGNICAHGPVVIFAAEDDRDEIHRRIANLYGDFPANIYAICLPDMEGLHYIAAESRSGLEVSLWWKEMVEQLERIKPKLIVIDPIACFVLADLNSRQIGASIMGMLTNLAKHCNAAVIAVHHLNKLRDDIKTLDQAKAAIAGTAGFVDHGRGAYVFWPEEEGKAKALCAKLDTPFAQGKVVKGGLAKANFPGDKEVKTYIRDERGLLVVQDHAVRQIRIQGERELLDLLEAVIAHAAAQGKPFTHQGINGLHRKRERLPERLRDLGRNEIEHLGRILLNEKRVDKYRPAKGGKTEQWLDVPGGNFAIGMGEFEHGEFEKYADSNTNIIPGNTRN